MIQFCALLLVNAALLVGLFAGFCEEAGVVLFWSSWVMVYPKFALAVKPGKIVYLRLALVIRLVVTPLYLHNKVARGLVNPVAQNNLPAASYNGRFGGKL
jgi:hypothetical protein